MTSHKLLEGEVDTILSVRIKTDNRISLLRLEMLKFRSFYTFLIFFHFALFNHTAYFLFSFWYEIYRLKVGQKD